MSRQRLLGEIIAAGKATTSSYRSTVLADSPVAYYRLNEATGTSAADSAGLNTGTYTGGFTLSQAGATSDSDKATLFDGSTGFVTVPNATALQLGDNFTLEAWVKLTAVIIDGGEHCLVGQGTGSGGGPGLVLYSNQIRLMFADQSAVFSTNPTALTDTSWHYMVATKAGSTSHIYIDAVSQSNSGGASNHTFSSSTSAFAIGCRASGSAPLGATIDEVAIYNYALTSTQVAAHYAAK